MNALSAVQCSAMCRKFPPPPLAGPGPARGKKRATLVKADEVAEMGVMAWYMLGGAAGRARDLIPASWEL